MKVCHVTSVHPVYDTRIFHKECSSLAAYGYDVYLLAINADDEITTNGVRIIGVPYKGKNRLGRMFFAVNRIYKKALEINADVYHLHDPELLRIALKLKKKGKNVIFDSHEFYGLQILEKEYLIKPFRSLMAKIYMSIEAYVCNKIDAVIQVTTLNGYNYFHNRSKKNVFITNVPILDSSKNNINNQIKRNSVIYVGGLTHQRGITTLVKVASYTDTCIELVGTFSPDNYKNKLRTLKGYEKIKHLGYIEKNKILDVVKGCVAGISTLLNVGQYPRLDTLPTKVYEYLFAGIPVIISDTVYNRTFIQKYQCGILVNPENPKEIADAINYLAANPKLANEMGERGRKCVLNEFNWQVEENKLINLYKNLKLD